MIDFFIGNIFSYTVSFLTSTVVWQRLGNFWKILVTNFLAKVAQICANFLAILKNVTLYVKLLCLDFGQLLIRASGHTGQAPDTAPCLLLSICTDLLCRECRIRNRATQQHIFYVRLRSYEQIMSQFISMLLVRIHVRV